MHSHTSNVEPTSTILLHKTIFDVSSTNVAPMDRSVYRATVHRSVKTTYRAAYYW